MGKNNQKKVKGNVSPLTKKKKDSEMDTKGNKGNLKHNIKDKE